MYADFNSDITIWCLIVRCQNQKKKEVENQKVKKKKKKEAQVSRKQTKVEQTLPIVCFCQKFMNKKP